MGLKIWVENPLEILEKRENYFDLKILQLKVAILISKCWKEQKWGKVIQILQFKWNLIENSLKKFNLKPV